MATKYKRAGSGNWSADASWSTTSGGAADTVKPTAADDVKLDASSGALTIDETATCRSLDCTGYTGTFTHNNFILTIGDATAGAGNIALKFVAGMTYTKNFATGSAFSFISTSATVQTVDFAGKDTGNVTFNASSNGSWQFTGAHTCSATATVTLTKGTLDINGQTVSWGLFNCANSNVKSITFGAANVTITGSNANVFIGGNSTDTTQSIAASTITLTGANVTICGSYSTKFAFGTVIFSGGGTMATANGTGSTTSFVNLTVNGTAVKTDNFSLSTTLVVTGVLTLAGNSATNRLLVKSDAVGSERQFTNTGATMTWSNVDFQDITLSTAFNASAITGLSGDCGGNINITFTTAATQTWSGTSGGNWSANAWTSRVPLPQDDVLINAAFSGSQTVTADMPRLGKSINWTGATGTPTWSLSSTTNTVYGSITLISGMTMAQDRNLVLSGRGSFTLTSAGNQFPNTGGSGITLSAPGGTYTLQDALYTGGNLTISIGGFVTNGFNVTCLTFIGSGSGTRTITLGGSTVNITSTSTATVVNNGTTTGLTFSGESSTFIIANASTNVRTFALGGLTYGTISYVVSGSTGAMTLQGSGTIRILNFSDVSNARTLNFSAGSTVTILNSFNVQGSAGKLMTVGSLTAASHTLSKASGVVSCRHLSISYSIATGGANWYAGAGSTDGGNNSGWIFADAPLVSSGGNSGLMGMRGLNNLNMI